MSWNYRVVKELAPVRGWSGRSPHSAMYTADTAPHYTIREVYYNGSDDSSLGWTDRGCAAGAEDLEGLKDDLTRQLLAFDRPVLIIRAGTLLAQLPAAEAEHFTG